MDRIRWFLLTSVALATFISTGCRGNDLPLVKAGGVVKYKGEPLPGATVTFVSESGPPAIGVTDEQGQFELRTLGRSGAAVGDYGVSVIAQKDSREITPEEAQTMKTEELNKIRKSLIPEIYSHPRTSGLTQTVSKDASENHFTFELKD